MAMRSHAGLIFAVALGAASLVSSLALADETPAAAKLETKLIEATVTIDPALKAYPGLYDNLLAEGRRELAKQRAGAEKDRKETPDMFHDGRHYTFERGYAQRSAIGRYISITRADYIDGLGAHPNHGTNTILWDAEAKKRISVRPFFKETADNGATLRALAKAIRAAVVVVKKARDVPVDDPDTDIGLSSVKPTLLDIGALALAPSTEAGKSSGLISYFPPYAVGAYVEGDYTVFVPWTAFKGYLSPEGAALFGGERPKGDVDKDD